MTGQRRRSLVLGDGRRLAWREFGAPGGWPCLYTPGTPASGIIGRLYHAAACAAGVRWISIDKPGYGGSDRHRNRRFSHWPRDVEQLADFLGLGHFAVAGESGGAPDALALAHAFPDRVTVAVVIGGMGPWNERLMRRHLAPEHYRVYQLARREPATFRRLLLDMRRQLDDPVRRRRWLAQVLASAPPADQALYRARPEVLRAAVAAYRDALRRGAAAAADEMGLYTRRWGFRLADIRVPVRLWHGEADLNVPAAVARVMARRLPRCTARFEPAAGHALHRSARAIVAAARGARLKNAGRA